MRAELESAQIQKQPYELSLERVISGEDHHHSTGNPFKFDANISGDKKIFGGVRSNVDGNNSFAMRNQEFAIGGIQMNKKFSLFSEKENNQPEPVYIRKYKEILNQFYNEGYSRNRGLKIAMYRQSQEQISLCFKPPRFIFFREQRIDKSDIIQKNEDFYLTRQFEQKLVLYQLKETKKQSLRPIQIQLPEPEIFSSICYESTFNRIYCFSNKKQEVIVIGTKSKEVICQLPLKHQRMHPLLFIHRYKAAIYLMVIGGYEFSGDNSVEGSKYIQIFHIEKWEMSLNQIVLKINVGRIQPIAFTGNVEFQESGVYIIGGHTNVRLHRSKKLNFKSEPSINNSTNQTGIKIQSQTILRCFSNDYLPNDLFLVNNINVRFEEPTWLYGGQVLTVESPKYSKLELFLPTSRSVFEIKIINNDVNIKETEVLTLKHVKDQIGYHQDHNHKYTLYCIGNNSELKQVEREQSQTPSSSLLHTSDYPSADSKQSKPTKNAQNGCLMI